MGGFFLRAPLLGNIDWRFFLRAFLLQEFLLYVNALKTSISLHRGPAGKSGTGSFVGNFERKEVVYMASFLGP